jgi:diguanylate cyclase (GGDEF)-like protein/PAS domain S-box-containing protein
LDLEELAPVDMASVFGSFYDRALAEGAFCEEHFRLGGQTLEMAFNPVHVGEKVTGVSVFAKNITLHGAAKDSLGGSETIYRDLIEGAVEGIVRSTLDGKLLTLNYALARMLGYNSPSECQAAVNDRTQNVWVDPEERSRYLHLLEENGELKGYECPCKRRDGTVIWVSLKVRKVNGQAGHPPFYQGFVEDITERKRVEDALRKSQAFAQSTIDALCSHICVLDETGTIVSVNRAWRNFARANQPGSSSEVDPQDSGSPDDFAEGINYLDVCDSVLGDDAGEASTVAAAIRAILKGDRDQISLEYPCHSPQEKLWFLCRISRFSTPPAPQVVIEHINITKRKRAEDALAEREEFYRKFFEGNGSIMLLVDPKDGRIASANRAAAIFYGYSPQQLCAMTIGQLNQLSDEQVVIDSKQIMDQEGTRFLGVHRLACGELRNVEVHCSPLSVSGKHMIFSIIHDVTKRVEAENQLRDSEERFRATFEQAAVGIQHASLDGKFLRCNQRFAEIIGYALEEIPSLNFQQITHPEDYPANQEMVSKLVNGFMSSARCEKRYIRKNGSTVWVRMTSSIQHDGEGRPLHFITLVEDINALKMAEQDLAASQTALKASEARFRKAFQTSETRYRAAFEGTLDPCAICRLDNQTYIEVNAEFLKALGYERDEVIGKTLQELQIFPQAGDMEKQEALLRRDGQFRELKLRFRRKNGDFVWGATSASIIELDGIPHIFTCTRDLSPTLAAESEIYNLAFLDPLTNLPNRRLLLDELRQAHSNAVRSGLNQTLLLIDLDNFKVLNESLGHPVGDLMLKEIALRMNSCVTNADTVARIGGDEFAVMLDDLSKIPEEVAAHAKTVADKILAAIHQPFLLDGHECYSTASVGVTVFGDPNVSTNEILQQAEIALYQAKSTGRNTIHYFAPTLLEAAIARAALEADLRLAIDENQFLLYYQPQIMNGRLASVESLIRWQHPTRGLVLPNDFIPLAEETGLVVAIGLWGLETACKQLVAWAAQEHTAHLRIAVNISARHFRQPDFVDQVLNVLEITGAIAANLELEITESVMVEDFDGIIAKMTELKSHGVRFSLDDFGTGYSSLSYLKRLPLDHLKIDISFIREILTDATSAAIAQAIISLGQAMALPVIAEGVETEEQRGFLSGLGCHGFQGYLFSRPMPLMDFEEFLNQFAGPPLATRP